MRRDEGGMRQDARPFAPQADQVVAVGAVAVQKHDELARRAARRRRQSWSVEMLGQAQSPFSSGTSSAEWALSWP